MPLQLILAASVLIGFSGVPGLFLNRLSPLGQQIANALAVAGTVVGLTGTGLALAPGADKEIISIGSLIGEKLTLSVDALSAFFLVPSFLIGGLGSIYGMGYWKQAERPRNGRQVRFFYGTLFAAITLITLARNGVLFLMAWEAMALSAFFLIVAEDHDPAVRQAGWIYLVATHFGTLCLFAMFALLRKAAGSFDLRPLGAGEANLALLTVIFFLALLGFGLKAGVMPLHVWLPGAHGNAPSHVSAVLSGIVLKIGIYGIVRVSGFLPNPPASWGGLLLILGAISAVFGVIFAIGQHNIKRLLAYHSVENIGIIVMGLGLAMAGRSLGRADWIVLGLGGALLHVWNHGLFKSLLFFSAGSVIHSVHTVEIDRMGGLAKTMPRTAMAFLAGAVAICGLPPLNGFVSELLIYLGLFRTIGIGSGPSWAGAALAAPVLAMSGALAVACFVKVYGAVFLGVARSKSAARAHEAPSSMIAPMTVLAACCAAIGLFPTLAAPILERAVETWAPGALETNDGLASLAPLYWIGFAGMALSLFAAVLSAWLAGRIRREPQPAVVTWDCGYAAPSRRMQYTASSFAQMLTGLFGWVLRPRERLPRIRGLFPRESHFESHVDDTVLDHAIRPAFQAADRHIASFRVFQRGRAQQYVLYILMTVVTLLLWNAPLPEFIAGLFAR